MPLLLYGVQDGRLVSYTARASSPPPLRLLVGAYVGRPDTSPGSFQAANAVYGPLTVRRQFNHNIPSSFGGSASGADVGQPWTSFLSIKAPPVEVIDGVWDSAITALAASGPTDRRWWMTMWHEPENDTPVSQPAPPAPAFAGGAQQFVEMFQRFYEVAKAANPNASIGPVHLGSAWKSGAPVTGGAGSPRYAAEDWIVPASHADFYGIDTYNAATVAGRTSLATAANFQRWYAYFRGRGRPLSVPEFGRVIHPTDPAARPAELLESAAWLRSTGEFDLFMYWDADDPQTGAWSLTDPESRAAWAQIAEQGKAL
ncbi:hypothetical protein [Actinomadura sp. 3N508]|uniref:hypothetical protein n=1 Tax=Actinomadura sp. 3N508 TaxID=3375153 RepID=UPI00379BF885